MERVDFIRMCDERLKLVRTEYGFTQATMAHVIGISKKTLVEIEKGRRTLGWTASVALCTVFGESEVLAGAFGGNPADIVHALAFEGERRVYPQTMGGKVWWTTLEQNAWFKIQQNMISQHYRLLTADDRRIDSSFSLEDIRALYEERTRGEESRGKGGGGS